MGKSLSFIEAVNRVQEWKHHMQSLQFDSNLNKPHRLNLHFKQILPFTFFSKKYFKIYLKFIKYFFSTFLEIKILFRLKK